MTWDELRKAVDLVVPDSKLDTLQVYFLGPNAVDIQARCEDQWYTGVVFRREWEA